MWIVQFGLVILGVALIFGAGFGTGSWWACGREMRSLWRGLGEESEPAEVEPWANPAVMARKLVPVHDAYPDPNVMGMGDFVPDPAGPSPGTLAMLRAMEQTEREIGEVIGIPDISRRIPRMD